MSDTQSDADKIRNKRLAKLGGGNQSTTPAQTEETPSASATSPSSTPQLVKADQDVTNLQSTPNPGQSTSSPTSNPFSQVIQPTSQPQSQQENKPPPRITITPKTQPKRTADGLDGTRPRSRSRMGGKETLEQWEDRTLSSIFRITLDPERKADAHG
ncbi:hypothetical protein LTS18_011084, partial [Coniosporium uncinatum]